MVVLSIQLIFSYNNLSFISDWLNWIQIILREKQTRTERLEVNVKKHNCVEITRTVIVSDTIDEWLVHDDDDLKDMSALTQSTMRTPTLQPVPESLPVADHVSVSKSAKTKVRLINTFIVCQIRTNQTQVSASFTLDMYQISYNPVLQLQWQNSYPH